MSTVFTAQVNAKVVKTRVLENFLKSELSQVDMASYRRASCLFVQHTPMWTKRLAAAASTQSVQDVDESKLMPFESIPQPKSTRFFGTVLDYTSKGFEVENFLDHLLSRHKELGPIYREQIIRGVLDDWVVCSSPKDTETMLRNDRRFPQRVELGFLKKIRHDLQLHEGLVESNGEAWHKMRQVVNQNFVSNSSVWLYGNKHYDVAKDFVKLIEQNLDVSGEVPDFDYVLRRWSLESTGVFTLDTRLGMFSSDLNPVSKQIIDGMEMLMDAIKILILPPPTWKIYNTKELKQLTEGQRLVWEAVKHHLELFKANTSQNSRMANMVRSDLTDAEKGSVMADFIAGGVDTTANAAVFVLYALASNPEKQETLRQQIKEKFDPGNFDGKGLHQLPYLNATIREVQRLYPFTSLYGRKFVKDVILSNYRVPAGTVVINTSNLVNSRDPRYFDNPESFKPERWLNQKERNKARFSMVGSFGAGATMCPGRKFALQEIHSLVIALLSRYRLEYHHAPIEVKFSAVNVPSQKARFKFVDL